MKKNGSGVESGPVLVVHIGLNKTGSTSLQQFLYANRKILREKGVLYPDRKELMFQDAHHRLARAALPDCEWEALEKISAGDEPGKIIEILNEEIKASPSSRHIVISSELFSVERPEVPARYLRSLRGISGIKIVLYIRNYVDFAESLLAHQITCRGYDKEMVTGEFKRDFCLKLQGHYSRILDSWAKIFGRDRIELRILERDQLNGGDIISDFLSLLGVERDHCFQAIGPKNVSLRRNGLEYMMFLNSLQKRSSSDPARDKLIRWLLRKVPDRESCSIFNSDLRGDISAWSNEEYGYIAGEYLGRKDGVLFHNPGGKDIPGDETYPGLDPEFAVRISREIADRALVQGAFSEIRRNFGNQAHGGEARNRSIKNFCRRIPGSGMFRSMIKRLSSG